jgi:hypothetical protein
MKFKNNYIHELELNFSNLCGADCIMCSEPHGKGSINNEIMSPDTFNVLLEQLKDVKTDIIQTSGDGETFKNPYYLEYVRKLKILKPDVPLWIYNNFSMFDEEKVNFVLRHNIFAKINTRVDSLHKWIFKKSSGLDRDVVFNNIKYFLSINDKIPFVILYNKITDYYNRCKTVLGKRPIRDRFTDEELSNVPDEMLEIHNYFKRYAKRPDLIIMCKINHGLWGERYRNDVIHYPNYSCPKYNVVEKVCWVYPSGSIGGCCFSKGTEVFTNEGWKLFENLSGKEKILTRKANGNTEWSKITDMQKYKFNGELYKIKSQDLDLLVTPDHKFALLSKSNYSSKYAIKPKEYHDGYLWLQAKDLKCNNSYTLPRIFNWDGKDNKKYTEHFLKLFGD